MITLVEPARKSEEQFRDEVRVMTSRKSHCVPQGEVLERVNRYVRGWVNYFHLHNSTRVFARQRFFLEQRMRKYLQGRRQVKGFGFRRWPSAKLYKEFGLYAIPQYAPYRRTRMPEVKMIGKPYAGELHVRFDEGEQDFVSRKILNGHEAGNGGNSQGST